MFKCLWIFLKMFFFHKVSNIMYAHQVQLGFTQDCCDRV